MSQRVKAVYQGGAFIPREPCSLADGSEVELIIEPQNVRPPEITDPEERKRVLDELVERMRNNPIPADAPPSPEKRFMNEELPAAGAGRDRRGCAAPFGQPGAVRRRGRARGQC